VLSRLGILALEILGVLVAGLVIVVIALGWRLTSGPISLDFARGMLQDALAPRDVPVTVEIGEPVLTWRGWDRVFDVTINDVRVHGYDGALDGWAPSVLVRLSVPALLEGIAAPVRITVDKPKIQLGFTLGKVGDDTLMERAWAGEILSQISSPTSVSDRLSYLRLVEVIDAQVDMSPASQEPSIALRDLNIRLSRHPSVLRIGATGQAILSETPTQLAVDLNYDDTVRTVNGSAKLKALPFTALSKRLPDLGAKGDWSAPLDAEFSFEIGRKWELRGATGSISTADGQLTLPDLYAAPRHLDAAKLEFSYDAATESLDIPSWVVSERDISAAGSMRVTDLKTKPTVTVLASTRDFPGDRLMHFWPPDLGVDARRWMEANLEGGTVPEATLDLELQFDPIAPEPVSVKRLGGGIDFKDVTGYYFHPLPPATGISGRAEFDTTRFDITVDAARLNDLLIETSTVHFSKLDTNEQMAEIDTVVRGPVQSALRILNHEALDLGRHINLDTKQIVGLAGTRLRFAFPLLNDLQLSQVDFAASANLEGVGIPDIAFGEALADGKLTLELNRDSLRIDGVGTIAGSPVAVTLDEVFTPNARIRARKRLIGTLDSGVIETVELPEFISLEGPVGLDVEAVDLAGGKGELTAVVDLRDARFAIPVLKWEKPAKAAGRFRFAVDTQDGKFLHLRSANLLAADLGVDLTARFDPTSGAFQSARFDSFVLGDSTMNGNMNVAENGRIDIVVSGDRLDIQRFLDDEETNDTPEGRPFSVNARFDEVQVGALPPITAAAMTFRDDGVGSRDIQLNGRIGDEPISVGYSGHQDIRRFHIRAEDAGQVLRGFDMLDSIQDGQLSIHGTTTGRGANEKTLIDLSVREFGFVRAPVLAQLLNAAFLPGLVDILQGNGIRFEQLNARIEVTEQKAVIQDALAYGASLGISAGGEIDRIADTVAINGMIVPAYGLSRLIDQIPILGKIITGGEKEGLLAAEYLVGGRLDRPVVTVNPLTAFTPGFLRALVKATNAPAVQTPDAAGTNEGPGR
jgi:hypothetical protein